MQESSARQRTCKACPDSLPGIATPDEYSSLLVSRPYFLTSFLASLRTISAPVSGPRPILALHASPGGSRCPEHISALKNLASKRISPFYWVLCLFYGTAEDADLGGDLYVAVLISLRTISSIIGKRHTGSLGHR